MKYFKQYDVIPSTNELNTGEYLVDATHYESIEDLLARCQRDNIPLPRFTPGLVEDVEVDAEYSDNVDKQLFPEDYQESEPADPQASNPQTNINEQTERAEKASEENKTKDAVTSE